MSGLHLWLTHEMWKKTWNTLSSNKVLLTIYSYSHKSHQKNAWTFMEIPISYGKIIIYS